MLVHMLQGDMAVPISAIQAVLLKISGNAQIGASRLRKIPSVPGPRGQGPGQVRTSSSGAS